FCAEQKRLPEIPDEPFRTERGLRQEIRWPKERHDRAGYGRSFCESQEAVPPGEQGQVRPGSSCGSLPLCPFRKLGEERFHPDEANRPRERTNSFPKKWASVFSFVWRLPSLGSSQQPRDKDQCIVVALVVFRENPVRGALGRFV